MSELFAVPAQPRISRASLQAERREVLESVMGALCGDPQDADQLAACGYLLAQVARALTRSGANPASPAGQHAGALVAGPGVPI